MIDVDAVCGEMQRDFQNHELFCRESLTVENEASELVPMILSPGQLRLRAAIQRQRDARRPVRIIYLKSRRIQATTGTAAEFFHATGFVPGVHTVVLAHDATSTLNIFGIYKRFHDKYKAFRGWFRRKPSRVMSDRIYYEFGGDPESSFIQIHTAGNTNFGRSFRITNVHFSEFPYYENPGAVRASIMSAVPKLPDTCAVIEGTAKTLGDDFHRQWQNAYSGESEWEPVFMGWHEHPTNRMALSIPADQFQSRLSREQLALMRRLGLDLEQMNWWRYTVRNDFNGDIDLMRREHPATPEEAFMASSRVRFSIPHIERMPIQREAMTGELEWEEVGPEKRPVFLPNERGSLKIFRMPERGAAYAAGADPSGGSDANEGKGTADPDYAVCHIFDRRTGEQVAVMRLRCMPGEFGRKIHVLLRFYNNAQVAIERNGAGIGTLEALINCNYPTSLFYHRVMASDQDPVVRTDKIGWNTDEVSRQQLISSLDEAIRQSSIFVHDPVTQQELFTFIIDHNSKAQAQKGCHDDTVMALGLAVVVMSRMPMPMPVPGGALRPVVQKYGAQGESDSRGVRRRIL